MAQDRLRGETLVTVDALRRRLTPASARQLLPESQPTASFFLSVIVAPVDRLVHEGHQDLRARAGQERRYDPGFPIRFSDVFG